MMIQILKKYLFVLLLPALIFSCKTVKKLPATLAGASRAKLVGNWKITKIGYEGGLLPGSVQMLFDQPIGDFTGSIWQLTNSGNGNYTLAGGNSQTIFWSYNNQNDSPVFQFKKLYAGDSARKVQEGYVLNISNINDTQMILKSPVSIGDRTAYVVLYFTK